MEDEASGILAYNEVKNEMPSEHEEHIETIKDIISDEYRHLETIHNMMIEMGCKDTDHRIEEMEKRLEAIAIEEDKTKTGE